MKSSKRWFVWDGLGITCAMFTYFLIGYAEFVVVGVMLLPELSTTAWGLFHSILFTILAILAVVAHMRAMITDPGSIPLGNCTKENIKKLDMKEGEVVFRCTRCECIKTDRAHHCSTCKRCIRKMDHHCPWINNCVGESNQKFFVLFTFYIMVISIYALYLAVRQFFMCQRSDWEDCMYLKVPAAMVCIIFLIFEGILFGLFTLAMFCTQVCSICKDETGIENLKKEKVDKEEEDKSLYENLRDVFGGHFSIKWFSPFSHPEMNRRKSPFAYYEV
ncbi:palmitoyltransferase ZDHHC3-like [Paramuricea clavata]|uniref:Palmitoyltransferase n=1 Tax=Paramuricea clavata TaxID=317549 RepID=A0A7D9DAG7_PARCT|nr:palmitoyltransferase ZDHHC3-like [Paramuricea clavata]